MPQQNAGGTLDTLVQGFNISQMLRVVAELGIADRLPLAGHAQVVDLADECGVMARPLLRILRALAAHQVFRVVDGTSVVHTPQSILLRTDTPNNRHHAIRALTLPSSWRAWEVLEVALHGRTPHEVAWGATRFDYLRDHPSEARLFDAFMANHPDGRHAVLADNYDFSHANLIADVGGGNGEALRRILARYPKKRGIVYDRPHVVAAIAPSMLAEGRITPQGGDFFTDVPTGADVYLVVRVLHDWADEDASRILRSCRRAMAPESRLLIVESVLDPDPSRGNPGHYLMDMQMMAMFGAAHERTTSEFEALLVGAGFALRRVTLPPTSSVYILEAQCS